MNSHLIFYFIIFYFGFNFEDHFEHIRDELTLC